MDDDLCVVPRSARPVVQLLATRWDGLTDLSWVYGQGSVVQGFSSDSDLDFVAVWERLPDSATLPIDGRFVRHGELAMEEARVDGYDVDVQHVHRATFDGWIDALSRGEGWSGEQWPMPIHVAAGLAEGLLIADPAGTGAGMKTRLQVPEPALVDAVTWRLATAAPDYRSELERASGRGNGWLHEFLAVRLHKMIYTAWFLLEGHYPPFPKHLPQWCERFDMDQRIRNLEAAYWATADQAHRDALLADLASAVLDLKP